MKGRAFASRWLLLGSATAYQGCLRDHPCKGEVPGRLKGLLRGLIAV